ncbi:MAG: bi-domain-containing oxidoreductase [Deltaproteobacteria bacterium]|nr:bi-domain-containing oxidoreductase [Deltaproteobacteria bacterium]
MLQVVQDVRSGRTEVREIPAPVAGAGQVVVATRASLVSAGTERYVVELARKSLLGKARERPDQVRRVLQKVRQEGLVSTLQQVGAKLDEPMPLGYSGAGVVLECGRGVQELKPGDRVAHVGPHAGIVSVGRLQCAKIPDGVAFEQAAYASVASIALEGVRLARVTLGERVVVVGLGLLGQLCVALLKAQGCRVFGTDIDPKKLELARQFGADEVGLGAPREAVRAFSDAAGVDAVVITASTPSNEPIEFAAEACRTRGRIVLVGVVGLNLPRAPFFAKELEFTVSFSLGPGRTDPSYDEKGVDYPIGQVRWTAQRNMAAVLDTIAQGRLPVEKLTTHRFPIERAPEAYDLITGGREPFTGVVLAYPELRAAARRAELRARPAVDGDLGVSLVGAGNYARLVMMPALARVPRVRWRGLCSARGLNAAHSAKKLGFEYATSDVEELLKDPSTRAVFLATRHDLHADLVLRCLRAGKHVFVEKPLCITPQELVAIDRAVRAQGPDGPMVMPGFNRRFAEATGRVKEHFRGVKPLTVHYRFAPGYIPANAWPQDEDVGGGRIVGEACHALDLCLHLVGSPPVKVYAESVGRAPGLETTDDQVFITARCADGSVVNVSYQAAGDRGAPAERLEVLGGGRTATVEDFGAVTLWRGGQAQTTDTGKDRGHAREFRAFLDACRVGGAWPVPWEDSWASTWASLAAVRSLREGYPVWAEGEGHDALQD